MRTRFLTLFALAALQTTVNAQFRYKIKADSVKITNDSCTAELILENSTKSVKGFLFNRENGRTEFRAPLARINDTTYLVGDDTLKMSSGSSGLPRSSIENGRLLQSLCAVKDLRIIL